VTGDGHKDSIKFEKGILELFQALLLFYNIALGAAPIFTENPG